MKKLLLLSIIFLMTPLLIAQWEQIGPPGGNVSSLAASGSNVFAGTEYGLYISTDNGQNWTKTSLDNQNISDVVVSNLNVFAGTWGSGIYHSTDNGQNWILSYNTGLGVLSLAVSGSNVFAGMSDVLGCCVVEFIRSTDNGQNWTQTSLDSLGILSLAACSPNVFAGSWGLYLSTDNGQNWTQTSLDSLEIISLAVSDSNVLAGTEDGYIDSHSKGVYLSTDNGQNWTQTKLDSLRIESLAVNGSNVFAGTSSGVYLSTDNGESWTQINEGMGNQRILSLVIGPNYIYAGTAGESVWRRPLSEVVPVELTSFTASVTEAEVQLNWTTTTETNNKGFEIYRNGNKIAFVDGKGTTTETQNYSFTDKNLESGIYNYRLNQIDFDGTQKIVGETTVNLILPEQFSLEQNYPNPFNPSTTIKYSIPASEFVTLKVYDVLGNEVATLVNEQQPVGSYDVEFSSHSDEGQNLSSGVYLYTLQSGSFTQTKKIILMK